jgi:UDP-N-acetylglucosamine transferase subunit ALG13
MIFVTTGTDHHPYDRLIEAVDSAKGKGLIQQPVFIQTGSSSYVPRHCEHTNYLTFDQVKERIREAKIIITHGGPGTIMPVVYSGKVPIVVPRKKQYGEAVDDHQFDFAHKLEERGLIIAVVDIADLASKINNYDDLVSRLRQRPETENPDQRVSRFARALESLCLNLVKEKKP